MRKAELAALGIVVLSFVLAACAYPYMPDRIASHWNAAGEVDGYMPKLAGLFLLPFVTAAIFLLCVAIPRIDPMKANIEKFRKHYERFMLLIMAFMLYIYVLTMLWETGARFNIMYFIVPAIGILIYYCGVLMENSKRNWFIGIRTPWTMSSDMVWKKTHAMGGKLFKAAGVVTVVGVLFGENSVYFALVPIVVVAVYSMVYSYIEYRKLKK